MKKVSPDLFRRSTGCTSGELHLLMRSPHVNYSASAHTFDADAARIVLEGIRQARAELMQVKTPRPESRGVTPEPPGDRTIKG